MQHRALRSIPPTALAILILSAMGCGDDAGAGPDGAGVDASTADAAPDVDADPAGVPRLESASCRYQVPTELGWTEGADYACGDLVVWEDRAEQSRTIRVHHVRIEGADTGVATIYLDGGPGGNGGSLLAYLGFVGAELVDGLLAAGDLVIVAQRGTDLSIPPLVCDPQEGTPGCAERLSNDAHLPAFNTAANADDVDELRAALGYEALNVYGISYGSRLALEVLRRHGDDVRSAVIGGVVPAQIHWAAETPASFHGALTGLADACLDDAGCAEAYGDVAATLETAIPALNADPVSFDYQGQPVPIDGDTLTSLLFQLLYSRSSYPMLPLLISDLADRRTDRVSDYLTALFDSFGRGGGVARGLYYAVVCGELFNPPDESAFTEANQDVPETFVDTLSGSFYGLLSACESWPVGEPMPTLSEPVASEIPTLVASGSFDPITPPRFADVAAETLANSDVAVFDNSGHGATLQTSCGRQALIDFLATPTSTPDLACAAQIDVSFQLPAQAAGFAIEPAVLRFELERAPVPPHVREPIRRLLRDVK